MDYIASTYIIICNLYVADKCLGGKMLYGHSYKLFKMNETWNILHRNVCTTFYKLSIKLIYCCLVNRCKIEKPYVNTAGSVLS